MELNPAIPEVFDVISLAHTPVYGEGWVMVMVCYLDDSDAEGSSVATLAGYVATADNWKIVEQHLQEVCAAYGVSTLHAKEFHDTKGDFKGWSRIKKNTFVDELYAKANHLTWGIAYSAAKDWVEIKTQVSGNERMSLFGLIFGAILLKLVHGNPLSPVIKDHKLSFLVESGHKNNSEIEQYFHRMKNLDTYEGFLASIAFVDKHSSRSIQLADFLAFHTRRRAALACSTGKGLSLPPKDILKRIHKKVPHLEAITPKGMKIRNATFEEFRNSGAAW